MSRFFISILILLTTGGTMVNSIDAAAKTSPELTYCTPAVKIDFNPFRELKDYYDLTYLTLLAKPYISKDPTDPGILSHWDFSADGKTFFGRVSAEAKWLDGTPVTAEEAAFGIARGLKFRMLGQKIKVKGSDEILEKDWMRRSYSGITIRDATHFELTFESDIKALPGTLRDALSQGSLHNRLWPARMFSPSAMNGEPIVDLVSRYPLSKKKDAYFIHYLGHSIRLSSAPSCHSADFRALTLADEKPEVFSSQRAHSPQTAYAVPGPSWLAAKHRQLLAYLLREALSSETSLQREIVPSHFIEGEMGWHPPIRWKSKVEDKARDLIGFPKRLKFASKSYLPPEQGMRHALSSFFNDLGMATEWHVIDFSDPRLTLQNYDVYLAGGSISEGRQIWIQDIFNAALFARMFQSASYELNFPRTQTSLKKISQKSSSSTPVNHEDLLEFNRATEAETSIIPLYRSYLHYFSRKSSPVELLASDLGDLTFRKRL